MSSINVYTAEKISTSKEELSEKAQKLAIEKDRELPKVGIAPSTIQMLNGGFCFKYGRVDEEPEDWFDGTRKRPNYEDFSVIVLESGHVAIEDCKKAIESEIIEFMETHFLENSCLSEKDWNGDTLRKVEQNSTSLHALYSTPSSEDTPEKQKATDKKDLRGTEYYDRMIQEPMYKLKVKLSKANLNMKIGLDDDGKLTLHRQNIDLASELHAVRAVIKEIESLGEGSSRKVQTRLESSLES